MTDRADRWIMASGGDPWASNPEVTTPVGRFVRNKELMLMMSPLMPSGARRRSVKIAAGVASASLAVAVGAGSVAATSEPAGSSSDYCGAHVDLEMAFTSGDDAATEAALAAATAVVPDELAGSLEALVASVEDYPFSGEFDAAYGQIVEWLQDNCDLASVEVLATDYAFSGLPSELPAGPTMIELANDGAELHELLVMRKNDGVTESFEAIIELPQEEAMELVTIVGSVVALPGGAGVMTTDLTSGDYLAICFLPTGLTPEVAEIPEGSAPPLGPPHFVHGMMQELTVP